MGASLPPLPMEIVDLDLAALPERLASNGWVRLVVWHRDLCLGGADVAPDRLPMTAAALYDVALDAALPALWVHLFAPAAETRVPPQSVARDDVLAVDDPFGELHRRLDVPPGELDDVSVVVCTRDRPEHLERCLSALEQLDHPPAEIVVVDNASATTETKEVVSAHTRATYVREDRPGLDIARNTGLDAATLDIVAFVDDDVEVHPAWLGQLRRPFEDGAVAATGLVLPAELRTSAQVVFEQHWSLGKGFVPRVFGPRFHDRRRRRATPVWEVGAGANMAFRRDAVLGLGGFDERLDVGAAGCSGDSELWYRLLSAGHDVRYVPTAVVRHRHRATFDELRRQIHDYMRGHAAALLVQHQRTGDRGNLVRLIAGIPRHYVRTWLARRNGTLHPDRALLREQISGVMAGVWYHLRRR